MVEQELLLLPEDTIFQPWPSEVFPLTVLLGTDFVGVCTAVRVCNSWSCRVSVKILSLFHQAEALSNLCAWGLAGLHPPRELLEAVHWCVKTIPEKV